MNEEKNETSKRPRMVYWVPEDAHVEGHGFRVSIVVEGEGGHHPTGTWPYHGRLGETMPYFFGDDLQKAREACYRQNERMGVSREETDRIVEQSIAQCIKDNGIHGTVRERRRRRKKG